MIFHINQLQQHICHPYKPENMQNGKPTRKILQDIKFLWAQKTKTDTEHQHNASANEFQKIYFSHRRDLSLHHIWNDLGVVFDHFQFIHIFCSFHRDSFVFPMILSQKLNFQYIFQKNRPFDDQRDVLFHQDSLTSFPVICSGTSANTSVWAPDCRISFSINSVSEVYL